MYQYKDLYTIDFRKIKYYLEMHRIIKESLDFPDYYGENWDAFWDCLTDMIGDKIHIEILGLDIIERKFGQSTANTFIDILRELKHYRNDKYAEDILIEIVDGDTRIEVK